MLDAANEREKISFDEKNGYNRSGLLRRFRFHLLVCSRRKPPAVFELYASSMIIADVEKIHRREIIRSSLFFFFFFFFAIQTTGQDIRPRWIWFQFGCSRTFTFLSTRLDLALARFRLRTCTRLGNLRKEVVVIFRLNIDIRECAKIT